MADAKIWVSTQLPGNAIENLANLHPIKVFDGDFEDIDSATHVEGLLTLLSNKVDLGFLDRFPNLKIVSNYAVGYNNIDVAECVKRGIAVTNTPGVLTNATAELTWTLIFSVARHAVSGHKFVEQGQFKGWGPDLFLGTELSGQKLGILGMGRIGKRVAEIGRAFGMEVLFTNSKSKRSGQDRVSSELGDQVSLETLLSESDVISVHCPLTSETNGLLGAAELGLMKPTAIFINTSRGEVHDEAALAEQLMAGKLAGVGLDVYEHEPKVHEKLLGAEHAVLLPHVGSATLATRSAMADLACNALIQHFQGQVPENLVPECKTP